MRAIVISSPGNPDVLRIDERPVPEPRDQEVLIRVHAAGINRPDIAQRKGYYPAPPGAPADIPGLEVSGVIEALGKNCKRWKLGDRVCALLSGGGYAEYSAVPEGQCLPIPGKLNWIEAATLPETCFTVWSNVFQRGNLQSTETLLIHGGAGGIGVAAIQIAKAKGATVFTTAGTDEKCSFCESIGATRAINYNTQEFNTEIARFTNGKGVNVILDMIGGDYTQDNLSLLSEDGRLVLINFMRGEDASIKLGMILKKRLILTGSTLRARDADFKSALASQVEQHVWPLLINGKLKPIIFKTFSLEHAADAHRLMETGNHWGKIVLTVNH